MTKLVWVVIGELEVPEGYDEDTGREAVADAIRDGEGQYYELAEEEKETE